MERPPLAYRIKQINSTANKMPTSKVSCPANGRDASIKGGSKVTKKAQPFGLAIAVTNP